MARYRKAKPHILEAAVSGPAPRIRDWRKIDPDNYTRAENIMCFIEGVIPVPEGPKVGEMIHLDEFQEAFIYATFDNTHKTELAILSLARKNGKTAIIGAILLAFICGPEARQNAQLVSGALSRDQAALVFELMSKMIMLSEDLSEACRVIPSKKEIVGLGRNVNYKALSADGSKNVGRSPLLAIMDESGQIKGPRNEFFESISTAQGAHDDPLMIIISTQAPSDADLLSVLIDDAIMSQDQNTVCHLYAAKPPGEDEKVDLLDKKQWKRSNPALGIFRNERDLEKQLVKAARMPSAAPASMNLLLNMRIALEGSWVSPTVWKENMLEPDLDLFTDGRKVAMGLDLSARNDLTAAVLACKDDDGNVHLLPYAFCPTQGIAERAQRDRAPYDVWVSNGEMIGLGGASMDYEQIFKFLKEDTEEKGIEVTDVEFDRWRIDVAKKAAENVGAFDWAEWNQVGQGYQTMSPILENVMSLLLEKKIRHGNHPVLNMCASNAISVVDPTGSTKLDKSKSTQRIDVLIAAVMAIHAVSEGDIEEMTDIAGMIG